MKVPEGYVTKKAIGKEFTGLQLRVQVSPLDCTGCGNCVDVCLGKKKDDPTQKALVMKPLDTQRKEEAHWQFAMTVPEIAQSRCVTALKTVLRRYAGKTVVIGGHGTAISAVVNYFDGSFGWREFEAIAGVMPWIVELDFDENGTRKEIRAFDPISGTRNTHKL